MSRFVALARAAAVVAVGIALLNCAGPGSPGAVGGPSATSQTLSTTPTAPATPAPTAPATPAPTPSPSPTINTTDWKDFVSTQYGYTIGLPAGWRAEGATRDWVLAEDRLGEPASGMNGSADHLLGPYIGDQAGDTIAVNNFAADVPAGTSEDDWLASYYADGAWCPAMPDFQPITVDGHPGRLDTCFDAQAIVFIGNRVYVFSIWVTEEQPLFTAFLSTVRLPATAP